MPLLAQNLIRYRSPAIVSKDTLYEIRRERGKEDVDSAALKVAWSSSVGQADGICGNEDYIVFKTISRNEQRNQDEKYMLVTLLHISLHHYLSYSFHPLGSLSDGV